MNEQTNDPNVKIIENATRVEARRVRAALNGETA